MRQYLIILITAVFTFTHSETFAQTNIELAQKKTVEAIKLMDNGEIEKSLELLDEAFQLNPNDIIIPYEIAYAHYLNKDYKTAISKLDPYIDHPKVQDIYYSLLGNSWDYLGNKENAINSYLKGIDRFPNSGPLHLEMGVMKLKEEKFNDALMYFENGIRVAPTHPSNYYWASKLYGNSSEKVWGVLYGELFMNIERGSNRTKEISKTLYHIYDSAIEYNGDTSISVNFSNINQVYVSDKKEAKKKLLPFGVGVFEPILLMSLLTEKEISIPSLIRIRAEFIKNTMKRN